MTWTDAQAKTLLASGSSFSIDTIVRSITPTGTVSIPVVNNNAAVQYSMGQSVARSAAFTTTRATYESGALDPLTSVVTVGCRIAGVQAQIPLFTGRIITVSDDKTGGVQVVCNDFGDDVINNDFPAPWVANISNPVGAEIRRIIQDANPTFVVDYSQAPNTGVAQLVWEANRNQALEDLANGSNAYWCADRTGGFDVFTNPYASFPTQPGYIILKDGTNGTIVDVSRTQSRAKIFNQITLVVERADPAFAPVRISARDNNPVSRTRWGGPFGYRNRTIKIQTPLTALDATALAVRILRQNLSLAETWTVSTPFMPLVDQADVMGIWYRGVVNSTVVESATINLAKNGATKLTCRKLALQDSTLIGLA